jgi:hypothetical protein
MLLLQTTTNEPTKEKLTTNDSSNLFCHFFMQFIRAK